MSSLAGAREHRKDAEVLLLLGLILALGLVLRIVFWYGLVTVDPYAYADSAASIARWKPVFSPDIVGNLYYTQYIRLSLTVPAAAVYRVFGPGEVVSTVVPIAASLGIAVIAFELARRAGGSRAGLIAAFLACVFPINVINSTQFLPDTMMAFFTGLTMLLFLNGLDGSTRRQRVLLYFATGVAWALAFYGKQTAVAVAIPFALLVFARRRFHGEFIAGITGALLILGAVQLLLMSLGGSFLEDIRTVVGEGRNVQPGALGYTDLDLSYIKDFIEDPMFIPTTILFGIGMVTIIAAEGWRGFVRGKSFPLLVLVVGQYVYFEFLMRLPSLYSWWKEPRYVLSMLIPMFALTGIGLSRWLDLLGGGARRVTVIYVIGGLLFATGVSISTVRNDHAYWREHRIDAVVIELADAIGREPPALVFTWDDDLARYLSFHLGLDRTTVYERNRNEGLVRNRFDPNDGRDLVEPGSLVVVNEGQDRPGLPTAVPASWRQVWEKPGVLKLYNVPKPQP
ncbi:MAG: glycosyltransferase family 39 protein [Anaerolineaceae bacterium]